MYINGTQINRSYDKDGNLVMSVNDTQVSITPDIMSRAWILMESERYDLIKSSDGWKRDVYEYIISDKPDVFLIALLLAVG